MRRRSFLGSMAAAVLGVVGIRTMKPVRSVGGAVEEEVIKSIKPAKVDYYIGLADKDNKEVSGAGYVRQKVTVDGDAVTGEMTVSNAQFPKATESWGKVYGFILFNGDMRPLYYGKTVSTFNMSDGDTLMLNGVTITVS